MFNLITRLTSAISTFPNLSSCWLTVVLLFVYGLLALILGFSTNFLQWKVCSSRTLSVRIVTTSFFAPALLEEIFFRVLLLPYPLNKTPDNSWLWWAGLSLFLFVVYHPLNAFSFFPQGRKTFCNPIFLGLALGLGIVCTVIYGHSGSLWLPVLVHWLVVISWLLFLGGLSKLDIRLII